MKYRKKKNILRPWVRIHFTSTTSHWSKQTKTFRSFCNLPQLIKEEREEEEEYQLKMVELKRRINKTENSQMGWLNSRQETWLKRELVNWRLWAQENIQKDAWKGKTKEHREKVRKL